MTLEWANLEKALGYVKEEIIDNMGNRHFTLTIFLDFRKAFDPIEHYILFFYGNITLGVPPRNL